MNEKGCYGEGDLRCHLYQVPHLDLTPEFSNHIAEQAKSVACLVKDTSFEQGASPLRIPLGKFQKLSVILPERHQQQTNSDKKYKLGEKEKFRDEFSVGVGTAFLIHRYFLLTAAHCVCITGTNEPDQKKVESLKIVFDFKRTSRTQCLQEFEEDNVYDIDEVSEAHYRKRPDGKWEDWALIRLKRPVVGRKPLSLDLTTEVKVNDDMYMIGHPWGMPMIFTRGGQVQKKENSGKFSVKIDAFSGNSGAPVFSRKTGKCALGMLVAGEDDLVLDHSYVVDGKILSRLRVARITGESGDSEVCQRLTAISVLLLLDGTSYSTERPNTKLSLEEIEAASLRSNEVIFLDLKNCYLDRKYLYIDRLFSESKRPIEKSYVNLAISEEELFYRRQNREYKLGPLESSIADLNELEQIAIKDIFGRVEDKVQFPKLVIEGVAGVGKSTLCHYLTYLWANKKLDTWRDKFDLVIWIPLRNLQTYTDDELNLETIIYKECLSSQDANPTKVKNFLKQFQGNILYLLDGYDEIKGNTQLESTFQKLTGLKYWIVTSRANCLERKVIGEHRHLVAAGFTNDDMVRYIRETLEESHRSDYIPSLILYLERNKAVQGIAHIPINLELVCTFWQPGFNSKDMTLTSLYQELIKGVFGRYLDKNNKIEFKSIEEVRTNKNFQNMFSFYEELAWKASLENKVLISKKEYLELLTKYTKLEYSLEGEDPAPEQIKAFKKLVFTDISFIKETGSDPNYSNCYFIHKTFQEYFAASHLARMFSLKQSLDAKWDDPEELIDNLIDSEEFFNIFVFCAGILCDFEESLDRYFDCLLGLKGSKKRLLKNYSKLRKGKGLNLNTIKADCLLIRCVEEINLRDISQKRSILKLARQILTLEHISDEQVSKVLCRTLRGCYRILGDPILENTKKKLFADKNGFRFLHSNGLVEDEDFLKSAQNLDHVSIFKLAQSLIEDVDIEKDFDKGLKLFDYLLDNQDVAAQFYLGSLYLTGEFVKKDIEKAMKYYELAAAQNHPQALNNLSVLIALTDTHRNSEVRAFRLLVKASTLGCLEASKNLIFCYRHGFGTKINDLSAKNIFYEIFSTKKESDYGDYASSNVLFSFDSKHNSGKLTANFLDYLSKLNNFVAQYNLGVCYNNGRGVEKDLVKAVELYTLAADQGHATAQTNLGICYEYAIGVKKDLVKAVELYTLAADQGHATAQTNLGFCYEYATGVDKDMDKAFGLYKLAADQGNATAQSNLKELEKSQKSLISRMFG